jgi:hypothetical protein
MTDLYQRQAFACGMLVIITQSAFPQINLPLKVESGTRLHNPGISSVTTFQPFGETSVQQPVLIIAGRP